MKYQRQQCVATALGLAALALILAAPQAYAEPVRFDNPAGEGHFAWTAPAGQQYLTVLAGPESQPGTALEQGTFWRRDTAGGTTIRGRAGSVELVQFDDPAMHNMLFVVGAGDTIPSPIVPGVCDGLGSSGFIYTTDIDPSWPSTLLPEGEEVYLGVSFDLGAGDQYGWIGLVRTDVEVDAFAWGYETEVGVPIPAGIPEPATLAILAVGAAALLGRRRHDSQID